MPVVRCRLVQLNVKRFTDLQGQSTVEVSLLSSTRCTFRELNFHSFGCRMPSLDRQLPRLSSPCVLLLCVLTRWT